MNWGRMAAGGCRRVPTSPDTAEADSPGHRAPRRYVDRCFDKKLKLHGGKLTLPRSYILRQADHAGGHLGVLARRTKDAPAGVNFEIDSTHTRTSPRRRADGVAGKIAPESRRST